MAPPLVAAGVDARGRILLRDFALGVWAGYLALSSPLFPPTTVGTWAIVVASATISLALALVTEHTARFEGVLEDPGPHVVAGLVFAISLVTAIGTIAGLVPLAALHAAFVGALAALLPYRFVFGVVRPLPPRALERRRTGSGES